MEKTSQIAKLLEVKQSNSNTRMKKNEDLRSMDTPMNRIMLLHKTIGNQAMQRLIKSRALQAKHRIGQPEQFEYPNKIFINWISKNGITDIVQKSRLTGEQTDEWNQQVVHVIQQAIEALNRRPTPDFDLAESLTRQARSSALRLYETFNMITLRGIPRYFDIALRDIQIQGRYLQVGLRTVQYEVQRMFSIRHIPPEQQAIWNRSVIQVIQDAIDILDRHPEQEDFYRARSLIREADRNTRELFRSYNLDARDLPHIQSYLNRTYSLMSDFRSMGIRPIVYLRLALIEAQSIPSRDDAR